MKPLEIIILLEVAAQITQALCLIAVLFTLRQMKRDAQ